MLSVLSGGTTVLTILMGVAVLLYWYKPLLAAIRNKEPFTVEQWFILGVFLSFVGQALDNTYWLITWTVHYFHPEGVVTHWLFDNGTLFNLPFRQAAGITAAYCHVKAAIAHLFDETVKFRAYMVTCCAAGMIYSLWMVFAKSHYGV